jgi:hypothetical protein
VPRSYIGSVAGRPLYGPVVPDELIRLFHDCLVMLGINERQLGRHHLDVLLDAGLAR